MVNLYHKYVSEYARLFREGTAARPQRAAPARHRITLDRQAPDVLLFSPHPDDECIVGALPLRLLRELKMRVTNVAVTLGSRKDRRLERLQELRRACDHLSFDLVLPDEEQRGLEKINPDARCNQPALWKAAVGQVTELLRRYKPQVVFFPHAADANSTHAGVNALVRDALEACGKDVCCWICETEYWAPIARPNLMVESSVADVADLVTALAMHSGEIKRNPYHLRMPSWMMDNVRRGSELIGGQGGESPNFIFATLYHLHKWAHGHADDKSPAGRLISDNDSLEQLFG